MDLQQIKSLKNIVLTVPGLFGVELYPFQKIGTAAIQATHRILLGDDVGLGKTFQSVSAIQLLHNTDELIRNDTLIVCPKAVRPDWFKTFKNHTALTPIIGDESDQNCKYLDRKWNVLILGFPTVRVRIEKLVKYPWKMIVLDEGMFKNSESQTFATIKQLTDKAQRVVILNATSLEINLTEIYSHIEIMHPGLISFQEFKDRFCKVETKYFRTKYKTLKSEEKVVGPKSVEALEDLKKFMAPFYIKRSYSEVSVQLPEKIIKNIRVELLPSQKKEYVEQIKKYKDKELKGAQLLYNLLRICDGKLIDFEKQDKPEKTSAKGEAFISLMNSLGKQQAVVYSTYLSPLLAFAKMAKAAGKRVGFFTGQNESTRDQHLNDFKMGTKDYLFLTKAGQRGINLENCAHLIAINQLFNNAATTQLHGRISRITSKYKNIFVYNLLTVGTAEENVLELLENRGILSELINEEGLITGLTQDQIDKILKPRKSLINEESLNNSIDIFE